MLGFRLFVLAAMAGLAGAAGEAGGAAIAPANADATAVWTSGVAANAGPGSLLLAGEPGPALIAAFRRVTPESGDRGYVPAPGIVRALYWGALELLSRRQFERACESLVRLEAPASESLRPEAMELLRGAELELAQRLAEIAGDSLYPIVALHEEMSVQYLRRERPLLAEHSLAMSARLASLYAESPGRGDARQNAAGTLAALAGEVARTGRPTQVRRLLDAALAIEPASEPALLLLAVQLERYGRLEEAVPVLRRLVEAHPHSHEGALRLAVCLRRSGRAVPEGLLRACLVGEAPSWVRAVAYDELARAAADSGDWKAAIAVLTEGVRSFPAATGLAIELAHALDRDGRPREALTVAREVAAGQPGAEPSPRLLYAQPVPEAVRRERARLPERTREHLAALASALATTMAPAGE